MSGNGRHICRLEEVYVAKTKRAQHAVERAILYHDNDMDSRIDGITDQIFNLDDKGAQGEPQLLADFQGRLDAEPDHHQP